jgi:hypothetical protein
LPPLTSSYFEDSDEPETVAFAGGTNALTLILRRHERLAFPALCRDTRTMPMARRAPEAVGILGFMESQR